MDFIICFNRALGHQMHEVLVASHVDVNEEPKLKSSWPIESQMVKAYTKISLCMAYISRMSCLKVLLMF